MAVTTTDLIIALKRRATVPTVQSLYKDEDFAALLNEELQSFVVPFIAGQKEEYFSTHLDYTVSSTNLYPIPAKAMGGKLKDVCFLIQPDNKILNIPMLSNDQMSNYLGNLYQPNGFYVEGYNVKLYPDNMNTPSNTMRVFYYARPNTLKKSSEWGVIEAIDTLTNIVTLVAAIPSTWTTSTTLDLISNSHPHETLLDSVTISNVNTMDRKLTLSSVVGLSVGDFVCVAGEAAVAQYIPIEFYNMLVQSAANSIFRGLGDQKGLDTGEKNLSLMEKSLAKLICPRIDYEPKKITRKALVDGFRRRF